MSSKLISTSYFFRRVGNGPGIYTSKCGLAPNELISRKHFSKGVVVYVADDAARAKEAEAILKHFGHANVLCYLAGMEEWEKVGGLIKYPKFVTYDVSLALQHVLKDSLQTGNSSLSVTSSTLNSLSPQGSCQKGQIVSKNLV